MNKTVLLPLLALAGACAPAAPLELSGAEQAELNQALTGYAAVGTQDCVNQRDIRGNRSVGEGVILFEGNANRLYVNRPAGGCPDLRGTRTLATRTSSTQLCRGDIAQVVDLPSGMSYGGCGLGSFNVYERRR